jgi:hypothetical protein
MKNTPIIRIALLLLAFLTATSWAQQTPEIVVYRGTARARFDLEGSLTIVPTLNLYVVVNYRTGDVFTTFFWVKNRQKQVSAFNNPSFIRTTDLPLGRTGSLLVRNNSSSDDDGLEESITFFRGANAAVTLATTPTLRIVNRPRSLSGHYITAFGGTEKSNFIDVLINVTLQPRETLEAGNEGLTVDQVQERIGALLAKKGFEVQK